MSLAAGPHPHAIPNLGGVQAVRREMTGSNREQVIDGGSRHSVDRLNGECGIVRRQNDIWHPREGIVRLEGLPLKHIKRGTSDPVFGQCRHQCHFVHDPPASRVHNQRVRRKKRDLPSPDAVMGCLAQRHVDRQHVDLGQDLLKWQDINRIVSAKSEVRLGFCCEQAAVKADKSSCDCPPDGTEPDNAHPRAEEFTAKLRWSPSARPRPAVELGQRPQPGKDEGQRVIGDRLLVRAWGYEDRNSQAGSRVKIDGVHSNAWSGNGTKAGDPLENVGRVALRTRDNRPRTRNASDKVIRPGVVDEVVPPFELEAALSQDTGLRSTGSEAFGDHDHPALLVHQAWLNEGFGNSAHWPRRLPDSG